MIANKILSCYNLTQLSGDATYQIFSDPLALGLDPRHISAVTVLSDNHSSDIESVNCARAIFKDVTQHLGSSVRASEEFNPEFYPSLISDDVERRRAAELDGIFGSIADAMGEDSDPSKIAVPITHTFDALGDYVQARISAQASHFSVVIKVVTSPDEYIQEKTNERVNSISFNPSDLSQGSKPLYH